MPLRPQRFVESAGRMMLMENPAGSMRLRLQGGRWTCRLVISGIFALILIHVGCFGIMSARWEKIY